jgi:hypothetical protein
VKAAGYQVIASSFRGALNQDGCLYLNKSFGIEEIANKLYYSMAKNQILSHPRPTQVKVAILKTKVLIHLSIFVYVKRWCLGGIKNVCIPGGNFNIPGRYLGILSSRRAEGNLATDSNYIFTAHLTSYCMALI